MKKASSSWNQGYTLCYEHNLLGLLMYAACMPMTYKSVAAHSQLAQSQSWAQGLDCSSVIFILQFPFTSFCEVQMLGLACRESCPLPEMSTLNLEERNGFVFVWTGLGQPQSLPEDTTLPPEGFRVSVGIVLPVLCNTHDRFKFCQCANKL